MLANPHHRDFVRENFGCARSANAVPRGALLRTLLGQEGASTSGLPDDRVSAIG